MPELKPSRAYHEALRRIGIQNPGEVGFQTPVQFTALVDDFTPLIPPVTIPRVAATATVAAAAATFSGIDLFCRPPSRGVYVTAAVNLTLGSLVASVTRNVPDSVISENFLTCFTGPEQRILLNAPHPAAQLLNILDVNLPALNGSLRLLGNGIITPLDFFLEPGQRFRIMRDTVNLGITASVFWREVPTGAPVEP